MSWPVSPLDAARLLEQILLALNLVEEYQCSARTQALEVFDRSMVALGARRA